MPNKEHVLLLLRSVASGDCRFWNNWRIDHPTFLPQLSTLDLQQVNLLFIDLSRSDLKLANFSEANLYRANLEDSDLSGTVLQNSNLRKANFQNSNLQRASLRGADLRKADLRRALLTHARLTDTIFDPDWLKELEDLCKGGMSRLERFALQISRDKKANRQRRL